MDYYIEYYTLKVSEGYAGKSGRNWTVGADPFLYPYHGTRHQLTLKEAKQGIVAIKKWYGYKDLKYTILKVTETRNLEVYESR